jgi:RF-1 domain
MICGLGHRLQRQRSQKCLSRQTNCVSPRRYGPMIPAHVRDALLTVSEEDLARQCKFEQYKSGGPGGQKRNKTSSAVKWTHVATGVSAHSADFRSQAENRVRALHRLRFKFATEIRSPVEVRGYEPPVWFVAARVQGKLTTNSKSPIYARLAAHVLDVFNAAGARTSDTVALLGIPRSNLIHFLKAEHGIWAAASRIRAAHGLPSLSADH